MKSPEINLKSLKPAVGGLFNKLQKYAAVLIFLLFTGIYGYMILKINTLSNPAIDDSDVIAEVKALPTPKIDESAVKKLQSLEDNSVNVQALFDQGRTNPFNE